MNLSKCTGKGVKIGLIDSGIDKNHPSIRNVKERVSVKLDPSEKGTPPRAGLRIDTGEKIKKLLTSRR